MRILFTGGGTGGHIYPIIAVKRVFNIAETKILYIGPDDFAKGILEKEGIECKFILAGKLRRYFSILNLVDIFVKIPLGMIQSLWHLFWFMPDVIFSKGGYGSIPVVFAGWLYRIPIVIHESDSIPGLTNRILSHLAKKIIISFEEAQKYFPLQKTILLGNPIRKELIQGNKEKGRALFHLSLKKPAILITGGSQGAQKINEIVLDTLPRLLEKYEIIHLCGNNNFKYVEERSKEILQKFDSDAAKFYHLYPFLEEERLKHAYAVSDIIISRAGAGNIFEIAAVGRPSILIPLSSAASDHQNQNAQTLAKIDGTIVLKEENLTINIFLDAIFGLINNPSKLKEMAQKAKSFYNPQTPELIRDEILKSAQTH